MPRKKSVKWQQISATEVKVSFSKTNYIFVHADEINNYLLHLHETGEFKISKLPSLASAKVYYVDFKTKKLLEVA